MSLFSRLFGNKPKSAATAKERLQLIIAHERSGLSGKKEFLPKMQKELIAVISKYVSINPDDIKVSLEKQGNYEVLEVNIVLPEPDGKTADKPDTED
jgi:cell division topological specificity factor minE